MKRKPYFGKGGTMAETNGRNEGRSRKRPAVKAASRSTMPKVKATIHLSIEADQRLNIHAAMLRMDRSQLVESLIHQHLRRFVVSDRSGVESMNSGTEESLNSSIKED